MSGRVVRGASVRLQLPGDDQGRRGADRGAQGQRHSSQETSRRAGPREVPVLPAHHHTAGTLNLTYSIVLYESTYRPNMQR